jgi:hypothetical protein
MNCRPRVGATPVLDCAGAIGRTAVDGEDLSDGSGVRWPGSMMPARAGRATVRAPECLAETTTGFNALAQARSAAN